ncbi:MAG: DinB family protein [Candidatus Hydrogenedens sp.]|nr:DinB family protein [Candidatus Hydrogenedens sp.]
MNEFKTLRLQRQLIHKLVSSFSQEELFTILPYRRNNIAWNLGHIVTIEQALTYGLSGAAWNLPDHYRAWYLRDTSPADWTGEPDVPRLLDELMTLPDKTEADYHADAFANYKPITTSTGAYLDTVETAIGFNNFHEGMHTGFIMAIQKELAAG